MVTMVTWVVTALLPLCYRFVTALLPGCSRMFPGCLPGCPQAAPRLLPGIAASSWTPVFSPELADMFDEIDIGKNILELAGYAI